MNPFKVGKGYSQEHFIDRQREIDYMVNVAESGNNLVILAPRRFGKTWLLHKFKESTSFVVLYVDLFGVISLKGLSTQLINQSFQILKEKDPVSFVTKYLKNLGRYISFSINFQHVSFSFSSNVDEEILLNECYKLLSSLSKTLKRRVIVIFDEFQEHERIYKNLPESLRSYFQIEGNVSFFFAGSKKHMLESLFFQKSGAMYHSCLRMDVDTYLPKEDCIQYAQKKFKESYKSLPNEPAEFIFNLTRGHPYFFQLLCYETWNKTDSVVTKEIVTEAYEILCDRESYAYDVLIDKVDYRYVRNILALLTKGESEPFSQETLKRYGIPTASVMSRTLKLLSEHGIVEKLGRGKYIITDPLFESYLQRRINL